MKYLIIGILVVIGILDYLLIVGSAKLEREMHLYEEGHNKNEQMDKCGLPKGID